MTGASRPIRVGLVDDEDMVRLGLLAWLTQAADNDLSVEVVTSTWTALLRHPSFPVDVVLLDFQLNDSVPATQKVRTLRNLGVQGIIISTHATPAEVRDCMRAGARGYLAKSEPPSQIIAAVRAVAGGDYHNNADLAALLVEDRASADPDTVPQLSVQELRALILYATGMPMKHVANLMNVSYETAKGYIDRVRTKYEQAGRTGRSKLELYHRAREDGHVV